MSDDALLEQIRILRRLSWVSLWHRNHLEEAEIPCLLLETVPTTMCRLLETVPTTMCLLHTMMCSCLSSQVPAALRLLYCQIKEEGLRQDLFVLRSTTWYLPFMECSTWHR